jgi:uncharacterized protein
MRDAALKLDVLGGLLGVARLDASAEIPAWAGGAPLSAITRTADELSIVCPEDRIPEETRQERGFRALEVRGPLDFGITGVISALSAPLAAAGIPIFVVSTFDTDYVLVPARQLSAVTAALREAGHEVFTAGLETEVG